MRPINLIYFLLPFITGAQKENPVQMNKGLFVCYGKTNPKLVKGYDLVILEAAHYNVEEVIIFKENNNRVVAYISLTEVNEAAQFFEDIKPYTLGKNGIWNSWFIDVSLKPAQQIILENIALLKQKGFDGLFLDNIDNVSPWGELKAYKKHLVDFIKQIRTKNLFLVQNSGLFLGKELNKITDAVLVESVITNYNFKNQQYTFRDDNSKNQLHKAIKKVKRQIKKPIYILEYADTIGMKNKVSKELSSLGFPFFITQINLQSPPQFNSEE